MTKYKHCEGCSCQELEFNGLICRPIEQLDVAFKDIVIPLGWGIPTLQEAIDLVNNEKFVRWSKVSDEKHDFYVEQPFNKNKGKYAAWLGCNVSYFYLYGDSNLNYNNATRGVLLVKKVEK